MFNKLKIRIAKILDPRPRIQELQLVATHKNKVSMEWKFLSLTTEQAHAMAKQDGYQMLIVPQMFNPYSRLDLRIAEIPASLLIIFEE